MATVRETLDHREKELADDIAARHGELAPLEHELAQIRRAKAALGIPSPPTASQYERHTIKQLIDVHFRAGATAEQLREFFRDAWGQEITRESLSPQLSRLLGDGFVRRDGHVWKLEKSP